MDLRALQGGIEGPGVILGRRLAGDGDDGQIHLALDVGHPGIDGQAFDVAPRRIDR